MTHDAAPESRWNEAAVICDLIASYAKIHPENKVMSDLPEVAGVSRKTFEKARDGLTHLGIEALIKLEHECGTDTVTRWIEAKRNAL